MSASSYDESHSTYVGYLPLDQISTRWTAIQDPVQFSFRYAEAIQRYITALVRHQQDAEDVTQDFLTRTIHNGFPNVHPDRGRFRDYLKRAVRNAAMTHLRKKQPQPLDGLPEPADSDPVEATADAEWIDQWRKCLLDKVWRTLDQHERTHTDNHARTVLQAWWEHPEEDSSQLAERVSQQIGRPLRAEAFRKQLSRARELFRETLIEEVVQTLDQTNRDDWEEELAELGLLQMLKRFMTAA